MPFSDKTKLIAMAIVHIFETSKPFGEYDAYVVLDDGAGVSYGLSQFTHRSGSLFAVIKKYLELGGTYYFDDVLPILKLKTPSAIKRLANDRIFKNRLLKAAATPEMRQAQAEIAQTNYFQKAVRTCEGSNFTLPLSLAVIYDSINHGSFEKIRDRVVLDRSKFGTDELFEKNWIAHYVQNRDAWLESVPRLKKTDYRTDFFLAQIARNNWTLKLPLNVHGYNLTEKQFKTTKQDSTDVNDGLRNQTTHEITPESVGGDGEAKAGTASEPGQTVPPVVVEPPPDFTEGERPPEVVNVPQAEPAKDEGLLLKAEKGFSWISGKILALPPAIGAAILGFYNWATNAPIYLTIGFFGASALIGITYLSWFMFLKNQREKREAQAASDEIKLKLQREQQAHEITLAQIRTASDPNLQTVVVSPKPLENSDSVDGVSVPAMFASARALTFGERIRGRIL